MISAGQALLAAQQVLEKKDPERKLGNILVEPSSDHFRVTLLELPKGVTEDAPQLGAKVTVDRATGAIIDVEETALPTSPYVTRRLPAATLTGRQAYEFALKALKGFENYGKDGKLTVELVDKTYRVTFPLPGSQTSPLRADYAFQVWVDSITGGVVKILGAS